VPTKLLAISGPLKRAEFPLDAHVVIGRDPNNAIHLDDPAVAPHHCGIAVEAGHLILTDLDSHSGTFVNGIPVKQRELHAGDEIAVGNSVFLLEAEAPQNAPGSPVKLYEREMQHELRTLEFHPHELLSLEPDKLASLPRTARMARNLSALLQISRAIGSLRDEESLPWQLLGMIFDVIPAERGAILLFEDNSHEVQSQVAWDRKSGPDQPVHISQAIVRRVVEERVSLLDSGAQAQQPSNASSEVHNARRLVLCVPMISNEKVIGVIYLESSSAAAALTEDDFELLTAIAGLGVIGIENARQFERLGRENQRLRAEVSLTHDMVGQSARMREVYQFIERVAPSDSTVLIYGESGTGKELAARAIHKNSPRKHQPFVALNCAALAENLLESELFGHEKGAFTSANCQKKGFLEVAEGGTIFLDEIGELSPVLQAKLLRVLQEREFLRVGGTRAIKINVRFLAATNKDLQKAVREETFRADLYHRLNVISIRLPSLAEHAEDIPSLAEHFAARHARDCNRKVTGISREALACLAQYDWPGNVRELANAMERAVVVGSSETILAEDLPDIVHESAKPSGSSSDRYHDAIRNLKKQLIVSALEQSAGNVTEGAKLLGVHANYLHRLMRNFELRPSLKKQTGA
jgi:transcriptional regulator with GAF, ATPase, and Fis domain